MHTLWHENGQEVLHELFNPDERPGETRRRWEIFQEIGYARGLGKHAPWNGAAYVVHLRLEGHHLAEVGSVHLALLGTGHLVEVAVDVRLRTVLG